MVNERLQGFFRRFLRCNENYLSISKPWHRSQPVVYRRLGEISQQRLLVSRHQNEVTHNNAHNVFLLPNTTPPPSCYSYHSYMHRPFIMCRVRHDDKLVYTLINQLNHFIQWTKEVYYCHCERSWSFGPVCEFDAVFFSTQEPGFSVIWNYFLISWLQY